MSAGDDWPCEAYGPVGLEIGALCFFGDPADTRACPDPAGCHTRMTLERKRVFRQIRMGAANGDPVSAILAEAFPTAESLLGGTESL